MVALLPLRAPGSLTPAQCVSLCLALSIVLRGDDAGVRQKYLPPYLREPAPAPEPVAAPVAATRTQVSCVPHTSCSRAACRSTNRWLPLRGSVDDQGQAGRRARGPRGRARPGRATTPRRVAAGHVAAVAAAAAHGTAPMSRVRMFAVGVASAVRMRLSSSSRASALVTRGLVSRISRVLAMPRPTLDAGWRERHGRGLMAMRLSSSVSKRTGKPFRLNSAISSMPPASTSTNMATFRYVAAHAGLSACWRTRTSVPF